MSKYELAVIGYTFVPALVVGLVYAAYQGFMLWLKK